MNDLFASWRFARGPVMRNRLMLAPMTNRQSHTDGQLSDDEYRWLTMRATGGFGAVMTCAAHVQANGQGFGGQLGAWDDRHLPGLTRLARGLRDGGSLALLQLHHAGMRAPTELIGAPPVAPSEDAATGARALTSAEVEDVREAFVAAAVRADHAGFDGIELHGAHGYLLGQFLSPEQNRRDDGDGGSPAARARLLHAILDDVRARCRPDFVVGVRLSPERFGLVTSEMIELTAALMARGDVDFIDLSLWEVFKDGLDGAGPLLPRFTALPRGSCALGVAGKLYGAADVRRAREAGADFALIGRAGLLHHDFPQRVAADPSFTARSTPVTPEVLAAEGLGPAFIDYMRGWKDFVTP